MKKKILNLLTIIFIIFIFGCFYYINGKNYSKISEIKYQVVNHPELLPKKDFVKYTSFGFSNLRADLYWLETIQYIGSNVFGSEYKKYLFSILDLITQLNPYFEKPYLIGQLLLPSYSETYENLTIEDQKKYSIDAENIGLKGIANFCDKDKIEKIKNENDLQKIWTNEEYKNPCKKSDIPFSQAFLYYYYLKNSIEAANYYKITSANEDSLSGAKTMAAIMSGKSGNREISIMMFLTLSDAQEQNENCIIFSEELKKVSYGIFRENKQITGNIIKSIEDLRKKYFVFNEEEEKNLIKDNYCDNYINKAVREFNLYYIEEANKKYFNDKKENALNAKILFDEKYIDFLPKDFQQYDTYEIIYVFNKETGNFDYKMGNY